MGAFFKGCCSQHLSQIGAAKMGQLILAEMLFEFPIFGPAAPPFHGAHEGNKGHGSKGQDVVPAILLDHAAKIGSTNLQIIRAVSLR